MENRHITDQQQVLAELARGGCEAGRETSTVVAPGARIPGRVVVVQSRVAYNVYTVRAVVLGGPGEVPLALGTPMEAVNVAEPFQSEGTLAPGTHVLATRVGEKNVFWATP